jgi:ribosomal protein S11
MVVVRKFGRFRKYGTVVISQASNNLFFTLRGGRGLVIRWTSLGQHGFVGPRKGTIDAAASVAYRFGRLLRRTGFFWLNLHIKSRLTTKLRVAIRSFIRGGRFYRKGLRYKFALHQFKFGEIIFTPPYPHNGMRQRKLRRV